MIKKTLIFATLACLFCTANANELSCGSKDTNTQKTILGELKKTNKSFVEQTKQTKSLNTESKHVCDEHCAEHESCEDHKDGHSCDEFCTKQKDQKAQKPN